MGLCPSDASTVDNGDDLKISQRLVADQGGGDNKEEDKQRYDVIVVGGGAAGLFAALKLGDHDIDCCLLEGSNRLCVRAWSEQWTDDRYIDYGCQWFVNVYILL